MRIQGGIESFVMSPGSPRTVVFKTEMQERERYGMRMVLLHLVLLAATDAVADTAHRLKAAVVPAGGTIDRYERKEVVIAVRRQLRYHGYQPAEQIEVIRMASSIGLRRPPSSEGLKVLSGALETDVVFWPRIYTSPDGALYLDVVSVFAPEGAAFAFRARLPARGAGRFSRQQVGPAAAVCIAELLLTNPNSVDGPFPKILPLDPSSVLRPSDHPASAPSEANRERGAAPTEGPKKEKSDWSRWDHAGIFAELGFLFSWCLKDRLCQAANNGYGGRIRFGVRIASIVAISFTGMGSDHKMPVTTDTEVFLNVKDAFVYAGIFGGIRAHPVRRFVVDPYVGLDLGWVWLLYAHNAPVEETSVPAAFAGQAAQYLGSERAAIDLSGLTIVPELGLNVFVAPPLAFGAHVQWIIPFWKKGCAKVYDPTTEKMNSTARVCAEIDNVDGSAEMADSARAILAAEERLPRFIALELNLTFVFK